MEGISLNFGEDGKASVKPPKIPLCLGWYPCEFLVEREQTIPLDAPGKFLKLHQQICTRLNMSVHQVFDHICTNEHNPCPRNLWYCADERWYYRKRADHALTEGQRAEINHMAEKARLIHVG